MSAAEKENYLESMLSEYYPGWEAVKFSSEMKSTLFSSVCSLGLDGFPDVIPKTMTPSSSLDKDAESAVLMNGGYDSCAFKVACNEISYFYPVIIITYLIWYQIIIIQ